MKNPLGFGLAMVATASFAFAGGGEGEGDKTKKSAEKNTKTLHELSETQDSAPAVSVDAAAGEGFTITAGDEFSLNLRNRIQAFWNYTDRDNALGRDSTGFGIKQARTMMAGHVWDDTKTYFLQIDWTQAGSANLGPILDAYFRWQFWESGDGNSDVALRVGQQKPHFGREFQGWDGGLENVDRSLASRTFTGNRVLGAWLQGNHLEGDKLHWNIGAANGDPALTSSAIEAGNGGPNPENKLNYYGDVRFDPMGDFGDERYTQGDLNRDEENGAKGTVGASVTFGNNVVTGVGDVESFGLNLYTAWKYAGFHALGEFFSRSDDPQAAGAAKADATGWAVGGSYTLPKSEDSASQWSFAARLSMVDFSDTPIVLTDPTNSLGFGTIGGSGDITEIEATVSNYYHEHRLKTQAGYRYQTADPDGGSSVDNHFFDILFSWSF